MSAECAPVSARNLSTVCVRAARSSSSKDQVAAPGFVTISAECGFDVPHQRNAALAERGRSFPGDVFAKQAKCAEGVAGAKVAQCRKPAERMAAEEVATVLPLKVAPRESAACDAGNKSQSSELAVTSADHITRRADSACAMVTPSAYSRSPPTGSPRAMRVIVSWYGDNLR